MVGDGRETTMKAVHVTEYVKELDDLKTISIPVPRIHQKRSGSGSGHPQQSQIVVRVTHTSPTHVDGLYARGLHQNNHAKLVHPPFTLGLDFAGVVVDVDISDGVTNRPSFRKGDQVWGTHAGSFATYVACPASSLQRLPPSLSLADAAGLGASVAPVSFGALVRVAQLKRGETVLVHAAAGGLGVAAVLIARAVGANVIGTVGSSEKKAVVEKLLGGSNGGLADGCGVVMYEQEGWEQKVKKISRGKGVDVVFDTVGLVKKSIRCCRFGGRIVIVGFVGLDGKMEEVAMNRILLKGVKVMGYRFGETARRDPEENVKTWEGFNQLVRESQMKPVIYKTYRGLDRIPHALQEMASRKVHGKIVIEVEDDSEVESGLVQNSKPFQSLL